jgi:hypothetical protein
MKPPAGAARRVLRRLLVKSRKIVKKQFFIDIGLNLTASFHGGWNVAKIQRG